MVAPAEDFLGAESGCKLWLMCLLCSTLPQKLQARVSVEYLEIGGFYLQKGLNLNFRCTLVQVTIWISIAH